MSQLDLIHILHQSLENPSLITCSIVLERAEKSYDFGRIVLKNMCTRVLRCGCKVTSTRKGFDGGEQNVGKLVHHELLVSSSSTSNMVSPWNR